jgi:capsular exopolysaccharide synthesis family protein
LIAPDPITNISASEPAGTPALPGDESDVNVFAFLNEIGVTNLDSLLSLLKKRVPLLAAVVAIFTIVAVVYAMDQVDVYSAAVKVQLAPEPLDPVTARYTLYTDNSLSTDYVNTEIQVLKSRLLSSIVLAKRPDVQKAITGNAPPAVAEKIDAIGALQGTISVVAIRDTRLIEIACDHTDPRTCEQLSNAVAEVYCDYKQDERNRTTSSSVRAIEEQIPEVRKQIEEDQRELDKLTREENSFEHERDLVIDRLKSYDDALNVAQRERVHADSDLEAIERVKHADRPIESAPAIASSGTIQRLRADLAQAEIEFNQLLERYQEDCPLPKVRAVKSRRDDLRLELASEIETIRAGLIAFRDGKLAEEQGLEKLVAQLRDEARRLGQQTQRYQFLQTKIENNQKLYQDLLRRASELATYNRVETSTIKIIDRAQVPTRPVRPNRPRTTLVGALLGLMAGLAITYLLERFDTRMRQSIDVRNVLGLDTLSLVPEVADLKSPELERLAISEPGSPFAEGFRRLRAQLHATTTSRVTLITSGAPAEGKSTVSVNLAVATAKAGGRVLLIDADMRNPKIHKAFHLEVSPGLADCLGEGIRSPASVVNETEVPNLYVMTAGRTSRNAAELLATGGHFERVIALLKDRFERIIIDTPPAAFLSDASIIVPTADTVLFVVSTKHSRRRASRLALGAITAVGAKPVGALLNHVSDRDLRSLYYESYKPYERKPDATARSSSSGTSGTNAPRT